MLCDGEKKGVKVLVTITCLVLLPANFYIPGLQLDLALSALLCCFITPVIYWSVSSGPLRSQLRFYRSGKSLRQTGFKPVSNWNVRPPKFKYLTGSRPGKTLPGR